MQKNLCLPVPFPTLELQTMSGTHLPPLDSDEAARASRATVLHRDLSAASRALGTHGTSRSIDEESASALSRTLG